ncbi:MAG: hypothetical protein A2Z20_03170 [Bdellovibrionales bacterium RBG_16_40_8]|nr:MAG: hypothetical protein A2Z20_03170 [Bdellovibrionales bacterium RBG_16_40_8]
MKYFGLKKIFCIKKILESFIEAFAAEGCELSPEELKKLGFELHQTLINLPPFLSFAMHAVFFVAEYAIPPLSFKIRPTRMLPVAKRTAYLAKLQNSLFFVKRAIFLVLKHFCTSCLYSHPRILQNIGYGPSYKERTSAQCLLQAPQSEKI